MRAAPSPIAVRLLLAAEIDAERLIAIARIVSAGALLCFLAAVWLWADKSDLARIRGLQIGASAISGFFLLGLVGLRVAQPRHWRPWMAFALTTLDGAIIGVTFWISLVAAGLPGSFAPVIPIAFAIPLFLSAGALRYRPSVQVYATALLGIGIAVSSVMAGDLPAASVNPAVLANFFSVTPNVGRLAMVLGAGAITALAIARGRRLLNRAVQETLRGEALTRFLPAEIAPLVAGGQFDGLRRGSRRQVAVLFVDMRDSTARAEAMDPARLSVFISAFRRRVTRVVAAHGGLVDKFMGDGAMIVFGATQGLGAAQAGGPPQSSGGDARRALDCARALVAVCARWQVERGFDPPLRIGVGVHCGIAFCGVVGDDARLEFTVIGDAVNVASRIEAMCKAHQADLLASREAVLGAGEIGIWEAVSEEPLRGRVGVTKVMQPRLPPLVGAPPG